MAFCKLPSCAQGTFLSSPRVTSGKEPFFVLYTMLFLSSPFLFLWASSFFLFFSPPYSFVAIFADLIWGSGWSLGSLPLFGSPAERERRQRDPFPWFLPAVLHVPSYLSSFFYGISVHFDVMDDTFPLPIQTACLPLCPSSPLCTPGNFKDLFFLARPPFIYDFKSGSRLIY